MKARITPNAHLCLPCDINTDIWQFYDILWVTLVVLNKLLVILLTIPLMDHSLEMNLYKIRNLPLTAPEYQMSAVFDLEGEYLAVGKWGMYMTIPDTENIRICMMSELGLCTIKNGLVSYQNGRMVLIYPV